MAALDTKIPLCQILKMWYLRGKWKSKFKKDKK